MSDIQNKKEEIWILADARPGTFSQSIGLAQELDKTYKIIDITYSIFAKLPNFLFSNSNIRLSKQSKQDLKNLKESPNIIISSGRRTAPIALYLKKKLGSHIKIIQIMNPELDFQKFDYVILPKHDNIDASHSPNLITTIGSLTKINDEIITAEKEKFAAEFETITQPKIALLVGGDSKKTTFEKDSAQKLAQTANHIAKNMNAMLLVINSRRTSETITKTIQDNLDCDYKLYDWRTLQHNPYLAILGYSDFFIVTGDSVSMISECASTGKPLYIFDEKNISTAKHRQFHHNLLDENYAKKLNDHTTILEIYPTQKLQETRKLSQIIKNNPSFI